MKVSVISIVVGALGTIPNGLTRDLEELRNWGTSNEYPNYSVIEIGRSIEKCPGDLRRLDITQIPGGARGVMVIVVGIGHDDTSSNPGREWLHFT